MNSFLAFLYPAIRRNENFIPRICSKSGNNYLWIKTEPQTCEDIDCDTNQAVCKNDGYNWIQTDETEGFCCGDDGINDLGLTVEDKDGFNRICLSKEEDLIGRFIGENTVDSIFQTWLNPSPDSEEEPAAEEICGTNWCWVSSTDDKYNIYTIKKPGELPFDVVSTVDDWEFCDEVNSGELEIQALPQGEATTLNHFYCYKEGNHWSWAVIL